MGEALIILLAVLLSGAAFGPAKVQIPVSSWQTINDDPRFRFEIPSPVEHVVDTDRDGTRMTDHSHWFGDVNSFSVTITDYPADIAGGPVSESEAADELAAVRDALAASFPGARIVDETPVRRDGCSGLSFTVRYHRRATSYRTLLLLLRPSGSLVHLAVDVDGGDAADPSIDRFFGSFAIRKD